MENACNRAAAVDTSDPYAVYHAAYDLARAYDKTIAALEASGFNLAYADAALKNTSCTYSGAEWEPSVTVTFNGNNLVRDTDYTVSYRNNVNVGTASVEINGIGNYKGTITKKFAIKPAATTSLKAANQKNGIRLAWKKVTGAKGYSSLASET